MMDTPEAQVGMIAVVVSVLVAALTLWWTATSARKQRHADLLLDSFRRMLSNSKKLTHETRIGFERLNDSASQPPLIDPEMRKKSNEYRHEVGIEVVILEAYGSKAVGSAARKVYDDHVRARHAIWHDSCNDQHDCKDSRRKAFQDVADWGPTDMPSRNIYDRFEASHDELVEAIKLDTKVMKRR